MSVHSTVWAEHFYQTLGNSGFFSPGPPVPEFVLLHDRHGTDSQRRCPAVVVAGPDNSLGVALKPHVLFMDLGCKKMVQLLIKF